jgi:glycosyltransferase involved in cell wall biosynthesis
MYSLVPGGAERLVVDLSNELAENNDLVLYSLRDDALDNQGFYLPDISNKLVYKNLKISPGFKPWLVFTFYRILKKEKPNVVHCHLNLVNYFFILSVLFYKKIRFIYTIHNSAEIEVKSEIERIIRRFFYKHKFFIPVAISDETKRSYQVYYKLEEVDLIYNGRKFCGKTIKYDEVIKEVTLLKPTLNTLTFCHSARFHNEQKNQEMLISVFNKLVEEGFDVILLIMGDGFDKAFELRKLANGQIHFLGVKHNVNDYLYASDAFCLSSNFEGMPISLIEAFACGCIPICTPVGGCVNSIEHGRTGFLSRTISEEDYLQAIKEFITNRNNIDKNRLVEFYQNNFSMELCTSKYIELYSSRSDN